MIHIQETTQTANIIDGQFKMIITTTKNGKRTLRIQGFHAFVYVGEDMTTTDEEAVKIIKTLRNCEELIIDNQAALDKVLLIISSAITVYQQAAQHIQQALAFK